MMTRPRAIEHITINTGAARMSPRSEVADASIALIRAALAGDGRLSVTGWRVVRLPTPPAGAIYDLHHDDAGHVARCWLCLDAAASDAMWEAATAVAPDERARVNRPRGTPWLAATVLPDAMPRLVLQPQLLGQAGDLERCVAWAIIEAIP